MNEKEIESYKQAARKEIGKYKTEKLEIVFMESLQELQRRQINATLLNKENKR